MKQNNDKNYKLVKVGNDLATNGEKLNGKMVGRVRKKEKKKRNVKFIAKLKEKDNWFNGNKNAKYNSYRQHPHLI